MASEWFYTRDHTSYGPVSSAQLQALARSGQLSPTDVVWLPGMAKWTPASKIPGLFSTVADPGRPAWSSGDKHKTMTARYPATCGKKGQ
jgi:hypothetical protein